MFQQFISKKPHIINKYRAFLLIICGVGGSRTLVHTGSKTVFYMLSPRLIVGNRPAGNNLICYLVPEFSSCRRNTGRTISTFSMPHPEHR